MSLARQMLVSPLDQQIKRKEIITVAVPDKLCPFFARTDWLATGIVVVFSLTLYTLTLAPTVTLEQSGAFVVAGQHLGVGRVPGYPVWHLLAMFLVDKAMLRDFALTILPVLAALGILTVLEWLKNIYDGKTKETQPAGPDDGA